MKYQLIMLAAGFSRRFGGNKLLYEVQGKPMYLHTFEKLKNLLLREDVENVVVVSQYPEILSKAEEYGFLSALNDHSEKGISSSLQVGIQKSRESNLMEAENRGYMFLVGDQPYLKEETIHRLLDTYREKEPLILCPCAEGKRGNPVIFSEKLIPELMALTGDTGGKQVILAHTDELLLLEVESKELTDIDHL